MAITGALLAAQVIGGLAQTTAGTIQANRLERPEYKIPEAIEANMTQAQRLAFQGMPDEQKQEFLQSIQRQSASSMQGLSDRKAGIGAISALNQQAQDSMLKLTSMDTQQRMQNINALMDMRTKYAEYSDKQFMLNQLQPFQQEMAAAQQFQSAGLQNIASATSGFATMEMEGINPFGQKEDKDENMFGMTLKNLFGDLFNANTGSKPNFSGYENTTGANQFINE